MMGPPASSEHRRATYSGASSSSIESSLRRSFFAIRQGGRPSPSSDPCRRRDRSNEAEVDDMVLRVLRSYSRTRLSSPRDVALSPMNPLDLDLPPPPFSDDNERPASRAQVKKIARRRRSTVGRGASAAFEASHEAILAEPSAPHRDPAPSQRQERHRGFRPDYNLGDAPRHPSHLAIEPTHDQALAAANSLRLHDFAFVKRSNGCYSYAIVAHRYFAPVKGSGKVEEALMFAMDDAGSTKTVRKRHWADFVRLPPRLEVQSNEVYCQEVSPPMPPVQHDCQEVQHQCHDVADGKEDSDESRVPPSVVAFDPTRVHDEECSMISSVSEKARMAGA